jgi:hypothetical protein
LATPILLPGEKGKTCMHACQEHGILSHVLKDCRIRTLRALALPRPALPKKKVRTREPEKTQLDKLCLSSRTASGYLCENRLLLPTAARPTKSRVASRRTGRPHSRRAERLKSPDTQQATLKYAGQDKINSARTTRGNSELGTHSSVTC